jgi:hypothetical protein
MKRSMRILTDNQESSSSSSSSQHCELNTFFETKFDIAHQGDFQEFDLLLWWKNHTESYPVLSQLARDVLVIPVSTICSEQAFSTSGRIIEPRRSCLTPQMVEVLTCLNDWEHAEMRMQHQPVNEELIQSFSNIYFEEASGSGSNQLGLKT